ncbi:hypothetical protein SAMN04488109_4950 [Chryseolinea serpens]|uniref:ADP-heptose:LPS heptosyltransferase n=1 Tax=Chryseolinea serpens TaxID=947013 RepID=A0A1M5VAC1_9BACT|nr:hypothetical protein [Chryseolinea serpens]SHH72044.1 hypothetical protein SAMN04488109_4950 [Chryseolinea serpens]
MINTAIDIEDQFLAKIRENNAGWQSSRVRKLLIIYDPNSFFIGDCLTHLRQVRVLKNYFKNVTIHIQSKYPQITEVIRNHPLIDACEIKSAGQSDLAAYDLVLYGAEDEREILQAVQHLDDLENLHTCLFAISESTSEVKTRLFDNLPVRLTEADHRAAPQANEIYLSSDELTEAQNNLAARGLRKNENLVVLLDSSTKQVKMLNTLQYFKLIQLLGALRDVRFLVFDKDDVGKEQFYKSFLSDRQLFDKIIFVKKEGLRQSISMLAHPQVKCVFGPCTGLLHCASGVYHGMLESGRIERRHLPILVAYCGRYDQGIIENEFAWWGGTLVDCIKLTGSDGTDTHIDVVTARDADVDLFLRDLRYCSEYTAAQIFAFMLARYEGRMKTLGLL